MRSARRGVEALLVALEAHGGIVASLLDKGSPSAVDDRPGPAQIAAAGPRTAAAPDEYELLLEMILEGSLLHYGSPRVVHPDDPDLALLLGDQLYAMGLERLAALGDLESVAVLAEVIARLSQAHVEPDGDGLETIWADGARRIGWGRPPTS